MDYYSEDSRKILAEGRAVSFPHYTTTELLLSLHPDISLTLVRSPQHLDVISNYAPSIISLPSILS